MTTATEQKPPAQAPAKGILVTEKALVKVRSAMAKEGISPEQGGLRLGVQGGGCSGLSYNIRFDTQPRERDRIFQFSDVRVLSTQSRSSTCTASAGVVREATGRAAWRAFTTA